MKVVFVDNFFFNRMGKKIITEINPNLGLMSLASILKSAGHDVEIIDPKLVFKKLSGDHINDELFDACARACVDAKANIVGFTAYGRTMPFVIKTAQRLKAITDVPIMVGGPHATIVGRELMEKFSCIDLVVRYEAESIIVPLITAIISGHEPASIPNLIYRRESSVGINEQLCETSLEAELIEMDTVPYPSLDLYPIEEYQLSELSLEAGRGCPFACTFCSTAEFFKRRYRLKSNQRLIQEMEETRDRYGVSTFNLNHDLFGLKKSALREFCRLVTGKNFKWKCSMRSDTLDQNLLGELVAAGCVDIYFGIETGSQRMQGKVKKNLDLSNTVETINRVVEHGISCTVSFITGFPEEDIADQNDSLNLIGQFLDVDGTRVKAQLHMLSPEPGSSLSSSEKNFMFDGVGPEAEEIQDAKMIRDNPTIFSVFYHYPSLCPRWRVVMSSMFVNFLIPELGVALTNYVTKNYFGGQLAAFFDEIVESQPHDLKGFPSIIDSLLDGTEKVFSRLSKQNDALLELFYLSRIIANVKQAIYFDNNINTIWLLECKADLKKWLDTIMNGQHKDDLLAPQSKRPTTGNWYLIGDIGEQGICANAIDKENAEVLLLSSNVDQLTFGKRVMPLSCYQIGY